MGSEPAAGAVIAERYRLDHLLGEGGMGSVWAATHLLTRGPVALKFLKQEASANVAAVQRFMREARAAAAVNHPNVIRIHDIFLLPDGAPVMVMDHLLGESLGQKLERERKIPLEQLAAIMLPVVSAVGTAHASGIVHRDLKPDNIFLARLADGQVSPKVLDFGIAKLNLNTPEAEQSANLTRTGALLGTPYYMSPEQVFGEKHIDARADVWAMGVILFEALTGVRPVDGDNLGQLFKVIATGGIKPIDQVAPELPLQIRQCISAMLIADRDRRAASLEPAFGLLRRYTDTAAQSFSDAMRISDSQQPSTPRASGGASAQAAVTPGALDPTLAHTPLDGHPATASSFASTGTGNSVVAPKRRAPIVAMVAGTVALGAAIAAALLSGGVSSSAGAEGSAAASDSAALPAAVTTSPLAPEPTAATTVTPSAPRRDDPVALSPSGRARPMVAPIRDAAAAPSAAQPKASAAPAKPENLGGVEPQAPF